MKKNLIISFIVLISLNCQGFALPIPDVQKVIPSDGSAGVMFGRKVSISGNYALIAADASIDSYAYILEYDGNNWTEKQKIFPSNSVFGFFDDIPLSINGNRAIIGQPSDQINGFISGSAYIFEYDGTSWVEMQYFTANDNVQGDSFGSSVDIDGDRAFIGASGVGDNSLGAVYVFEYDGKAWNEVQKITPEIELNRGNFGGNVKLSDDRLFIRSSKDFNFKNPSGAVHVYEYDGNEWVEEHKLFPSDSLAVDKFGFHMSFSRNWALIGTPSTVYTGAAYIYEFDGSQWNEIQKIEASDGENDDFFGSSVGMVDRTIFIGSNANHAGESSGAVYIFKHDGSSWVETGKIIPNDIASFDSFGLQMSVDSGRALFSSIGDDENGEDSGSVYFYDFDPIFKSNFD